MRNTSSHKKIIVLFAVILFFSGFYIYSTIYKTIGFGTITHKNTDNSKYFIYVNKGNSDIKLECTKDIYEKIIVDKDLAYGISYKWSTLSPEKGKLLYINFNDTIDNRKSN